MDPVLSRVIHDILPTEILEIIFQEHAKLEWEAPTNDGQVCRLWRKIILNTPRAWAHLEIRDYSMPSMDYPMPSMGKVCLRLHRSNPAPLHIHIRAGREASQRLYDLFRDHRTRIVSLRMRYGSESFFEGQDFPCMRLLEVARWRPVRWGSMPKLQSLMLGPQRLGLSDMVPLSELSPLKVLALPYIKRTLALRHSHSLTRLILTNHFAGAISSPLVLPSLTYLSLFGVTGLKPHVNAPRLVTYHEGGTLAGESFNLSLPSLVEYGVFHPTTPNSDPSRLHLSFPYIQRLAIRADEPVLLSFFASLANQPHLLPALQTISAGGASPCSYRIAEEVQEKIESMVMVRNEVCAVNVVLHFETTVPLRIPIYFGLTPDRTH